MLARARLPVLASAAAAVLTACAAPVPSTLARGMPTEVGQCTRTSIAEVGTRLVGGTEPIDPRDAGADVTFANGGYQVSYAREGSIFRSRVGDPVQVCLVSIPTGCPPGDDRGRDYATTNLRTGESWQLPDASHMCGGA